MDDRVRGELICRILANLVDTWPVPSVERYNGNPFKILIVSLLSTQTLEEKTIKAADALFILGDNSKDIAQLEGQKISDAIRPCAFYRRKTVYIKEVCHQINKNGGVVPNKLETLMGYPGIGWKVAVITLATAYSFEEEICIDTHASRISKRLGLVQPPVKDPQQISEALKPLVSREFWRSWNKFMLGLGHSICTASKPKCHLCPLLQYCPQIGLSGLEMSKPVGGATPGNY